jgi:hypothetical protein
MFASTQVLLAFPESPVFESPVERLTVTPPTTGLVEAFTDVTPAVEEFSVTEHEPVVPTVVQDAALRLPGPLTFEKLIVVPTGAFADPDPSSTFTCPVNVCGDPTSFVPDNGEIWMFASTIVQLYWAVFAPSVLVRPLSGSLVLTKRVCCPGARLDWLNEPDPGPPHAAKVGDGPPSSEQTYVTPGSAFVNVNEAAFAVPYSTVSGGFDRNVGAERVLVQLAAVEPSQLI